jgi:hypothetical protein
MERPVGRHDALDGIEEADETRDVSGAGCGG